MIVAAALFGEDVSPRLDCCDGYLILDSSSPEPESRRISTDGSNRDDRLALILEQKVETLLTGGIRRCDYFYLTQSGVNVLTGLTGEAQSRIREFLDGSLKVQAPFFTRCAQPQRKRMRKRRGG